MPSAEADMTLMLASAKSNSDLKHLKTPAPRILAAGATPLRCRRLQEDVLLDTEDETLRRGAACCASARKPARDLLTSQGSGAAGNDEDSRRYTRRWWPTARVLKRVFEELGLHVRGSVYEKYREEFTASDVTIALDENARRHLRPRLKAGRRRHPRDDARALGRSAADFILDSYRGLFHPAPRKKHGSQQREHGFRRRKCIPALGS
jgi:hypothetical protein